MNVMDEMLGYIDDLDLSHSTMTGKTFLEGENPLDNATNDQCHGYHFIHNQPITSDAPREGARFRGRQRCLAVLRSSCLVAVSRNSWIKSGTAPETD